MVGPLGYLVHAFCIYPHTLSGFSPMTEKQDNPSRDEVLKRMLKMPPKPHEGSKKRPADKRGGKEIKKDDRKSWGRGT
jgi:hypothetical protein